MLVVEQERQPASEGGRSRPDVDHHIVNGAVRTSNELGLSAPAAAVHSPHHASRRARLRVLDEARRCSRVREVLVEDHRVEGPGEESAVVTERLGDHDENAGQVCLFDTHEAMLP